LDVDNNGEGDAGAAGNSRAASSPHDSVDVCGGGGHGGGSSAAGGGEDDAARAARKAAKKAAKRAKQSEFKAARKQKLLAALSIKGGLAAVVTPGVATAHPFDRVATDDAETPFEAYRDIEPLLFSLANRLGKTKAAIRLYDPYFCEGSVVAQLGRLGFGSVINANRDFYADIAAGTVPEFDVLVTNPPFSGDHMKRALEFAVGCGKPWFLLMPDFVATKGYYRVATGTAAAQGGPGAASSSGGGGGSAVPVLFLGPKRNMYVFTSPRVASDGSTPLVDRPRESALPFQVFAAAFQCVWFMSMGPLTQPIASWWRKKYDVLRACECVLSDDPRALPQLAKLSIADGSAQAANPHADAVDRKRPWRKKLSRMRKRQTRGGAGAPAGAAGSSSWDDDGGDDGGDDRDADDD
jgi:hypothetical protein